MRPRTHAVGAGPAARAHELLEPSVGDPVGARDGLAVVEHGAERRLPRRDEIERQALQARLPRIGVERQRQRREPLADPVAAARCGEDVAPVVGVPCADTSVGEDHQVGHRSRRQQRLVPPRRQLEFARRPAEAAVERFQAGTDVDLRRHRRVHAVPRRAPHPVRLAGQLEAPVGLVEAAAQPARAGEERRRHAVLGVAEQLTVGRPPRAEGRRQLVHDRGERLRPRRPHGRRPIVGDRVRRDQRADRLDGGALARGGVGGPRESDRLRGAGGRARGDPDAAARRPLVQGDDGQGATGRVAAGGDRVRRPSQVGLAVLLEDDDAAVGGRRGERGLGQLLRRDHAPLRVLSTSISRNSADGDPCETGALWPGCPLPQPKVPHAR